MKHSPNYYHQFVLGLQKLKEAHPKYTIGKHLSTIIDEVGDLWGVTDKELVIALKKYIKQLDMDVPHEEEIDDIIKEGMDLNKIIEELHDGEDY
jgi:hypothetical protein